ncbi:hypothetical protein I0P70_00490 [Pontibacter sp. FD36]|uniref:HYC_CC_PP family protein n=1 Tax=Pontibacter sp. FD36 TaxID=2789860 RepID=UPI0018A97514|nr:hypothetical protein [Pontibacter sp. FD36]MBF8961705.1 hypothetical protein [Pontibacter sp. FD36]
MFSILYVTASSGAAFQLQFCKGQVVDVNVWSEKESCATECPTGKPEKECCKYSQQQLKADSQHDDLVTSISKPVYLAAILSYPTQDVPSSVSSIVVEYPKSNGPPLAGKVALYIKNCVFRI